MHGFTFAQHEVTEGDSSGTESDGGGKLAENKNLSEKRSASTPQLLPQQEKGGSTNNNIGVPLESKTTHLDLGGSLEGVSKSMDMARFFEPLNHDGDRSESSSSSSYWTDEDIVRC